MVIKHTRPIKRVHRRYALIRLRLLRAAAVTSIPPEHLLSVPPLGANSFLFLVELVGSNLSLKRYAPHQLLLLLRVVSLHYLDLVLQVTHVGVEDFLSKEVELCQEVLGVELVVVLLKLWLSYYVDNGLR